MSTQIDTAMNTATATQDPILVSVVRNRLDHITKEMGQVMLRTTRSPIFSEARDFVTAIYDRRGNKIAQTSYIPILVDATPWAMREFEARFGDDLAEGDIYILNDPYKGNNHSPDITIVKPVFIGGEHAFWTLSKGHHIDIGGKGVVGYDPSATSVQDEGMLFPATKLYSAGVPNQALIDVFLNNVVLAPLVQGDLEAQVGAVNVGERQLHRLAAKYGVTRLEAVIDDMLDATEREVRAAISQIPDGMYHGTSYADNDGIVSEPIKYDVVATVKGTDITFDLSGSSPQVPGYINSPMCNTASAVSIGLFLCLDPKVPHNDSGASRPIEVVAAEGTVVNPLPPAPVVLCTTAGVEAIVEAVLDALSKAVPQDVPAGWSRMFMPNTTGWNPLNDRPFGELHAISRGGSGGNAYADGYDHVGSVVTLGGFRASDPEMFELTTPYLLRRYEYLPDSAGPGEHRGGLGIRAEFEILATGLRCVDWGSGALEKTAAIGRQGGLSGSRNRHVIHRVDGTEVETRPNQFVEINKGDVYRIEAGGGGGYGDPARRNVEVVARDVREGVVSPAQAREAYKVVVDPDGTVDHTATQRLRAN
jgi:N-methylhydantoinase B